MAHYPLVHRNLVGPDKFVKFFCWPAGEMICSDFRVDFKMTIETGTKLAPE